MQDEGTKLSDLVPRFLRVADFIGDDGNQGKTMDYSYKNVNKKFAFYNLDNGMKLVLTAPVSEIYAEAYRAGKTDYYSHDRCICPVCCDWRDHRYRYDQTDPPVDRCD